MVGKKIPAIMSHGTLNLHGFLDFLGKDVRFLVVNKDPQGSPSRSSQTFNQRNDTRFRLNREAMMESVRHLHLNIPPSLISRP